MTSPQSVSGRESPPPPVLLPQHQALIEGSAIVPAVAAARGYRSVTTMADLGRLGFAESQRGVPALVLPVWSAFGEVATYQARPDTPRVKDGKALKYETPAKTRMVLDVPPAARPWLIDPHRRLFVTEGVRKADAAVSVGLACVDVLGVWNWRGTNDRGGKAALPDWEAVALNGRDVLLAFDSDAMTKPQVHAALSRLREFLRARGAHVGVVYLPTGDGGGKVGLDDFLAGGGTAVDLLALAADDLRPLPAGAHEEDTGPYAVVGGCLSYRKGLGDERVWVQLAGFAARVTDEVIADDGDTERGELVVAGSLPDGTAFAPARVPLSRFDTLSWVTPTWGARAVVAAGQGTRDRLREAILRLSPDFTRRREYTHPGWREIEGGWCYLSAGAVIGPDGPVEGVAVRLDGAAATLALPDPPDGDGLRAAVRTTLEVLDVAPDRITVPLLGAALRAPLNACGRADFGLFLAGPSGALKSELAALAQRFFGPDYDRLNLPASWKDTPNRIEKALFDQKDALCVVDDFAPGGTPRDVQRSHATADAVIRGAGNAAGRGRLNADGTARAQYKPRGLLLATGEDVPTGHSIRARLVTVEVEPGDVDTARLRRFQEGADRTAPALAMAGYLRWLAGSFDLVRDAMPEDRSGLRSRLEAASTHPRTPDAVANLALGWKHWLRFACDAGAVAIPEAEALWQRVWDALLGLAAGQGDAIRDESPVRRFLELLTAALASGAAHVAGPDGEAPERDDDPNAPYAWGWRLAVVGTGEYRREEWRPQGACVGWVDGNELFLEPGAAYAAAQRQGSQAGAALAVTDRTLWKRLDQAGLLARTEKNTARKTLKVRETVGGRRRDVLCVAAGILAPPEPDQPDRPGHGGPNPAQGGDEAAGDGRVSGSGSDERRAEPDQKTRPEPASRETRGRVGRVGRVPFDTTALWGDNGGEDALVGPGGSGGKGRCVRCGAPLPAGRRYQCDGCVPGEVA